MHLRNKILYIILLAAMSGMSSVAQPFQNSWINQNQRYFKISVAEDGLYRMTFADLFAAGVPVQQINPDRLQMFRRGKEIAIRVETNQNAISAVEFYGEKNNGEGDSVLYRQPEYQPHQLYNLFTDTSAYFLTWKLTGQGKRMAVETSLAPSPEEPYHLADILELETANYSLGQMYGNRYDLMSGMFDQGEGWLSAPKGSGKFVYTLNLSNDIRTAGVKPKLELLMVGRNNQEHRAVVSVGPFGTSLRVLDTLEGYSFHESFLLQTELEWSDVSDAGLCVIEIQVIGFPPIADNQSVAYLRLIYPQTFDYSGEQKSYTLRQATGDRFIRIPTSNTNIRIFDISDPLNPISHQTSKGANQITFEIENTSGTREILAVANTKSVPQISETITLKLDPRSSDYLIVSHKALRQSGDPVQAYADYRSNEFDVYVANVNDIYDQFNFGDPSPIAIRNYLKYAYSAQPDPQYLFLIGKATTVNLKYHRDPFYYPSGVSPIPMVHFVPTFGVPGSDGLFSVDIAGNTAPILATGRLNALTPQNVENYLEKVKTMEALEYNALWRKRILQLSGGQTAIELNTFARYIRNFEKIAEADYLGGVCLNVGKSSASVVEAIDVTKEVNEGVGLITFFGHSSSITTDVEIGSTSDGYANQGKNPVILMNGCNGGAIFGRTESFGEEWINAPGLGATAVIAHSDFAYSTNLRKYSDLFYQIGYGRDETFGMTLGEIIRSTQSEYLDINGADDEDLSQIYGSLLQGDPALKLFGANMPDYAVSNMDVSAKPIVGDRITSNSAQFLLKIPVRNFGRTVDDSLMVKVDRTLADGTTLTYQDKFLRPLYLDTLEFQISNEPGLRNDGQNIFDIYLDPGDSVPELSEINNTATFNLFLPKGNTVHLLPIDLQIVNNSEVKFTWQAADVLSARRGYSFQIDTSATFSSPFLQLEDIEGSALMSLTRNFDLLPDSTTIYWRTRFSEPIGVEDTSWVVTSFTLVSSGDVDGWGQFDEAQIKGNAAEGVRYDPGTGDWQFIETAIPVRINTHAKNNIDGFGYGDIQVVINGNNLMVTNNAADPTCFVNTFNAVVFDRENTLPKRPFGISGADISNDLVCGQLPQMIHNFTSSNIQNDLLDSLIVLMENGDGILLFSFDSVAYSTWDDRLKSSLAQVGVSTATINSLQDGQPVVFLGKKGAAEGEAVELINNGSGIPVRQQSLVFENEVRGTYVNGKIRTGPIGPARAWHAFDYNMSEIGADVVYLVIEGISNSNERTTFIVEDESDSIDLSSFSATEFPYLDVSVNFFDSDNLKPPQLDHWAVQYDLPPEGVLLLNDKATQKLAEGEPFTKDFTFHNISDTDFTDSVDVNLSFVNIAEGAAPLLQSFRIAGPIGGDSTVFSTQFNTIGRVGSNNLLTNVSANEAEQYDNNNSINLSSIAQVEKDDINPVLDVTFDGIYILDGDIVSPSPRILIKFKDDNPYLYKQDTSGIQIELQQPCESCGFERVNMAGANINITHASEESDFEIEYVPGPLTDGVYRLRVQGEDASGNASGLHPYEISFEVINESTITHFYPYPNPFSTSTRFVFTLTGSEIPDQIKIQIMTVSGRVVREITQDEIGDIKIGNNITNYAWDGRDEFGDKLANGVYLYKVFVRQNDDKVKHRISSGDRAFKNGFGKIYLLR